jgi:hypothetical protein
MVAMNEPPVDPVRVRRARVARFASIGQRVGYSLFFIAAVGFFVGLATGLSRGLVTLIEVGLLVGSAWLAPSIVLAYAVKAAERDDLEHGR